MREDFNGILNLLSAFAFWQQSGGLWRWENTLNYTVPCLVFHSGQLWWCMQANGPQGPTVGPIEPGTNEAFWKDFLQVFGGGGADLGDLKMRYGTEAPRGWLPCDGSAFSVTTYPLLYAHLGKATTPDMRGCFVRGYDPTGEVDPDGESRDIGSLQVDGGRNITGTFGSAKESVAGSETPTGAFYMTKSNNAIYGGGNRSTRSTAFDASRSWGGEHTTTEFRPTNISVLFCIKHD